MTLTTKPEVNNVRTLSEKDRATATRNMHKILVTFGRVVSQWFPSVQTHRVYRPINRDRLTDRQTDTLITILPTGRNN